MGKRYTVCTVQIRKMPVPERYMHVYWAVNNNLCIFCQAEYHKEQLRSVSTFPLSNRILEAAHLDSEVSVRLSGISDLIAFEGKYHLACLSSFTYKTTKVKTEIASSDLAMVWLTQELRHATEKGIMYQLTEVWNRYTAPAEEAGCEIPQCFISRRSTFEEKLQSHLQDVYEFVSSSPDQSIMDNGLLLIPWKLARMPVSMLNTQEEDDDTLTMPSYKPSDDIFLSLVHVALKMRADILAQPAHEGFRVKHDDVISCIPDSLYMFLQLVYGGQELLEGVDDTETSKTQHTQTKILSVAQYNIYGVSKGQKWTPKHIGLGSTLHQLTRSRQLVKLFHEAGHILSYEEIVQMDTALAESTLKSMNKDHGAVIPPNLTPDRFVHFTADNIDINDCTLDGKNTFHATQVAAWQQGPAKDMLLEDMKPSKRRV